MRAEYHRYEQHGRVPTGVTTSGIVTSAILCININTNIARAQAPLTKVTFPLQGAARGWEAKPHRFIATSAGMAETPWQGALKHMTVMIRVRSLFTGHKFANSNSGYRKHPVKAQLF